MKPYIGITDFTHPLQVEAMLRVFRGARRKDSHRLLHVGVMMSYKTLNGLETKWSQAFPHNEAIATIFQLDNLDVYHCLHYADFDNATTPKDLRQAITYGGPHIHAIQLDMPWPDPQLIIEGIRSVRQDVEIILQIGTKAIEQVGGTPQEVVAAMRKYDGLIDRVLLDKSGGKGIGMDAEALLPFAQAIQQTFPEMGLVVAGGLGPNTLHLVEPLVAKFPNLSIDAQGRLRPSRSALDPIDWDIAEAYLIKALQLLS